MTKYAQLPDGSHVGFPDDWSEQQMDEAVYRDFGHLFPNRQPGVLDVTKDKITAAGADILGSLNRIVNPTPKPMRIAPEASPVDVAAASPVPQLDLAALLGPQPEPDTFLGATAKHVQNLPEVGKMSAGGLAQAAAEPFAGIQKQMAKGESPGISDILGLILSGDVQQLFLEPFIGEKVAPIREGLKAAGQELAAEGAEAYSANQPQGLTGAAKVGSDVTRAITEMVPAYGAAFLTRNPAMIPAVMGAQVKGRSMAQATLEEVAPYKAVAKSNFDLFAEGLPEYIPGLAIMDKAGLAAKVGWGALGEGAQEMVTEVLQSVYDAKELEGMSLKDAIKSVDWGEVLYSGMIGVGAGGGMGATAAGIEAAKEKIAEVKSERDYAKRVDEALSRIADTQARNQLAPEKGVAPESTVQRPTDVGPAAGPATGAATELEQAEQAYAAAATEERRKRTADDMKRQEEAAEKQQQQVAAKQKRKEADLAYKQLQDAAYEKRKAEEAEAELQKAQQDTAAQEQLAEYQGDVVPEPTAIEQAFTQALDDALVAELKATLPEETPVEEPATEKPKTKLVHYSGESGLTEIDPAFQGSGIASAENKRKKADPANWVERSNFYVGDDHKKDVMLGKNRYEIEVETDQLYDLKADPDNLREGAREGAALNVNLYEKRVKEAGYKGYHYDHPTQGPIAVLFEKTQVAPTKPARVETDRPGGATAEFFTKMTLGEGGVPNAEYQPVLETVREKTDFVEEYNKHRGNFDNHIRASIPGFGEVQVFVGDAIVQTYGKGADVLDIGASEGSWAKTLSAQTEGSIRTTALDPLPAMAEFFNQEQVPGAEFKQEAFGDQGWTEPDGTEIKPFTPDKQYDVIHEAMTFQFIDNDRAGQIARAKGMLKPEGILLMEEKVKDDGSAEYANNETKKDEYKAQYFTDKAIKDKAKDTLVVGMNDNMVTQGKLEAELTKQFEHVVQYWDSGNFVGYVSSDSRDAIDDFLGNLEDTNSEFSNETTPREVSITPEEIYGTGTLYANPIPQMAKVWEQMADDAINKWNDTIGWRYDTLGQLPSKDRYKAERYKVLGRIADVDRIAKDVYSTFRNATEADQRAVYDYLTTPNANPNIINNAEVRRKAINTKRMINATGKALVDRGLLSQEAYERHQDGYLPRTYLRYLLGDKLIRQITGGKKASKMDWSRARKEIPKDVRDLVLGEITDPAYLAAKGLGVELRDVAIIDFLNWISTNQEWIHTGTSAEWNDETVSAVWLDKEASRIEQQAAYYKEDSRKKALALVADMRAAIADATPPGQTPPNSEDYREVPVNKRYGRLQGLWVRKEIYNDLLATGQIMPADADFWENWFGYGGKGTKVTQLWKMSKVAMNPPAQIRNAASNMILLHLSGMPLVQVPRYVAKAAKDIRKNGRYWKIAKKHGVTESTFAAQELYRIDRDIIDLEARMKGKASFATFKNAAAVVGEVAGDSYQFIEALGKTARIMYAMREEGMTADEAGLQAQKWLFDYSLVPAPVRTMRNMPLGVPFITFYYKVLPRLLEAAIKRPWSYLPYVALPSVMATLFADVNDVDDEDAKTLMKSFPEWLQDRGNAFLWPTKDEAGRWQAVDFGYILPWSMFQEVGTKIGEGEFAEAVKSSGVFGGPIPSLVTAIKTNTDPFTQKTIVDPGASAKDQVMSMLSYVYTLAMPTWLTETGFAGKLYDAITEDVEVNEGMGKTVLTPGQATLRLFGANVYPFDPERSRGKNIEQMQKDIQDIKTFSRKKIKDIINDKSEDKARRIEEVTDEMATRIQKLGKEIQTYAEESEVPEALKTQ